ncbi:DUF2310 family Zn-ribbon-containing protein [Rheinheimera sp.]|uniref:DUF2310 family Zn-ribbon-containing protein n=1 Tax=Rheinheimera sp. TaxID=1869214 RepID=UPI00307E89D1
MWVAELEFVLIADTSLSQAEQAIRQYLESLIFQGQLLGREFPTYQTEQGFHSRVVLPEPEALHQQFHSQRGLQALQQLAAAGLGYPKIHLLGQDLMSNHTAPANETAALIQFCSFSAMNSVLYCAEHFAPVPLYRLRRGADDFEPLIRWQLQYQALDEIQMQQHRVLPRQAELSLQQFGSALNQMGYRQARALSTELHKPVYYYLYSGSSTDCASEAHKLCPGCGGQWRLEQPWHQLFDFRCERCQLLSNIAFECS